MTTRLCYVDNQWAYFTTQPLDKQWGDDWGDAPYEHNAGDPYAYSEYDQKQGREPWEIIKVAWEGPLSAPCSGVLNSHYSVEMINAGLTPWLRTDEWHTGAPVAIMAGIGLQDFIDQVYALGGAVYTEVRSK